MNNTKVFGIESDNFYEFIKKINEFNGKNRVIATQTHYVNNKWFGIIYFDSQSGFEKESETLGKSFVKGIPPLDNSEKTPSFLSPDNIPPTDKQIKILKRFNLPIPKTKKSASEIIKQSIEGGKNERKETQY